MRKYLAIILSLMLFLTGCGKNQTASTWREQYDLGVRYLSVGNYEEAILAFEAAIEIDPKQADAYISLAQVYTAQGDIAKAAEILEQALTEIGETEALTKAMDALRALLEPPQEPEPSPEPEPSGPRTERQEEEDGGYSIKEYDDAGSLVRVTLYSPDNICLRTLEFDTAGNLLYITKYSSDGTVASVGEYDAAGNLVQVTGYTPDGLAAWYSNYEYNAAGDAVRETRHNPDGSVRWHYVCEYDAAGNLVSETFYNPDGTVKSVDGY